MTDYTELGRRLVACRGFRWMPGMLGMRRLHTGELVPVRLIEGENQTTVVDYRVVERNAVPAMNQDAARIMAEGYVTQIGWVLAEDLVPDLSDAATKGCVTKLVRELWPKEKWKQLGRSHSEIVKKLTWLSGPGTEEEVLLALLEQASDSEELEEGDYGRSGYKP